MDFYIKHSVVQPLGVLATTPEPDQPPAVLYEQLYNALVDRGFVTVFQTHSIMYLSPVTGESRTVYHHTANFSNTNANESHLKKVYDGNRRACDYLQDGNVVEAMKALNDVNDLIEEEIDVLPF